MRWSKTFIPTLKEDPANAEVVSHKLLVRAGFIRQLSRGIYDYLPLSLKVVRKIETIVREEMDRAGAQELLLPIASPAELWQESGRWEMYGKELVRFKDRNERDFCLGPTHEEVVTDLVRRIVRSYRELPLNLYQIQTKFRDEVRPRFGLMRGREFIMKDAYSFHADVEDCRREYDNMFQTYKRIFTRCGLQFRPVEADTGAIGGSQSHEFQVLAESGEDAIVSCNKCEYAANVQKAEIKARRPAARDLNEKSPELQKVSTPGKKSVLEVAGFLKLAPEKFIKTLVYKTDAGELVAALVRGDHEINEVKLQAVLGSPEVALANEAEVAAATHVVPGFLGPIGLKLRVVADLSVQGMRGAVMGANYLDAEGRERPVEMGCYGIGISRLVAAAIEQNNDANGIIWPFSIAPFHVLLLPINYKDKAIQEVSDRLYQELQ